ncbi:hypothetical protein BY996DRAFT_4011659 [Phakopsora pachyrhizi]|nr:hypothetical protein BY996DRAFT_4011659 [Phakopsora pachyrhizi]
MTKPQGGSRIESQQRGNNKRTNPEQSINKDSNQSKKTRTNQCKTERVEMPSIGSRASVQLDDPSILKSSPSSIDKTRSWELAVPLESDSSPKDLDEVISEDEKPMIKLEEEKEDEQGNDQGIGWERAVPICERERESSLSLSTNGWDLAERVASDDEEEEEEEEEEDEFEDDERKIADRFGLRDRSTGVTDWEIAVPLDRDSDENESENEAETEKEEAGELTRDLLDTYLMRSK